MSTASSYASPSAPRPLPAPDLQGNPKDAIAHIYNIAFSLLHASKNLPPPSSLHLESPAIKHNQYMAMLGLLEIIDNLKAVFKKCQEFDKYPHYPKLVCSHSYYRCLYGLHLRSQVASSVFNQPQQTAEPLAPSTAP